jgi:hypothetical protein
VSWHTPGPWRVAVTRPGGPAGGIEAETPTAVSRFVAEAHHRDDPAEFEANLHLIAAAPELLAALREAWDWIGRPASDRPAKVDERILAAIAKAQPAESVKAVSEKV